MLRFVISHSPVSRPPKMRSPSLKPSATVAPAPSVAGFASRHALRCSSDRKKLIVVQSESKGFAPLVTALSEPDHHALGVRPHPLRRCGELQRFAAVMAGRRDLDGFSDHWRNAERVGRATGVTLASA